MGSAARVELAFQVWLEDNDARGPGLGPKGKATPPIAAMSHEQRVCKSVRKIAEHHSREVVVALADSTR